MTALVNSYPPLPQHRIQDPPAAHSPHPEHRPDKTPELLPTSMQDPANKTPSRDIKPAVGNMELPPIDPGHQVSSETTSEMSLRDHLLAAQAGMGGQGPPQQGQQAAAAPAPPHHQTHYHGPPNTEPLRHDQSPVPHPGQVPPHDQSPQAYDPNAIAQQGSGYGMVPGDDDMHDPDLNTPDGKRGSKRELSTSKRAAQNRAAQRAFRQRKEGYIKKLEEENRQMKIIVEESYAAVQSENYLLRDYCVQLQNRLQEATGTYPNTPSTLQLRDPRTGEPLHQMSAEQPMAPGAVSQLQQASGYDQHPQEAAYPPPQNGIDQRPHEGQGPPSPSQPEQLQQNSR